MSWHTKMNKMKRRKKEGNNLKKILKKKGLFLKWKKKRLFDIRKKNLKH